jgi:large subunit ribosomal protein L17
MRHRFGNAKLKRDIGARNSLLKNLTTSVILEERVITTVPKAKAVQPLVEKMITLAKRDSLHTRRQAAAFLETPKSVKKLFEALGSRFGQRNGGYTRITRLGPRKGADRAKRKEERLKAQQEGQEPEENEGKE